MDTAGYLLSPGEVVKVVVFREPDLSGSYQIGPSGSLTMLWAERVPAAGLTVDQLRDAITERLRAMIKHPMVQVSIDAEKSTRRVFVGGFVEKQGIYMMPFGATVAEAVFAAGVTPMSELSAVRISRAGEPPAEVDLSAVRSGEGEIDQTMIVRAGDVIYVPRFQAEFSVVGVVAKPGSYAIMPEAQDQMNVIRALNAAGWLAEGAVPTTARLLRADGTTEQINLQALLNAGDMTQNLKVAKGDVLVVGQAGRITVAGFVTQPGTFVVSEPVPVLEAIARAGGFTPMADLKKATIVGEKGSQQVNLEKLWWQGDASQNIRLNPGQTLLIPQRDPETVLVVGAVEEPGSVDIYHATDRSAIRIVQGTKPKATADLGRVTLHRLGAEAPTIVDLRSAVERGKLEGNVPLQAGDIVFVPEFEKVYAIGAFTTPGVYPLTPDMTVKELIARAGSLRQDAKGKTVYLVTTTPEGPQTKVFRFSLLGSGRLPDTADYRLKEGDMLFVPSKKPSQSMWSTFRDTIWGTAGLFRVFFP
jgi:polysaccharide export outer membrane protein